MQQRHFDKANFQDFECLNDLKSKKVLRTLKTSTSTSFTFSIFILFVCFFEILQHRNERNCNTIEVANKTSIKVDQINKLLNIVDRLKLESIANNFDLILLHRNISE